MTISKDERVRLRARVEEGTRTHESSDIGTIESLLDALDEMECEVEAAQTFRTGFMAEYREEGVAIERAAREKAEGERDEAVRVKDEALIEAMHSRKERDEATAKAGAMREALEVKVRGIGEAIVSPKFRPGVLRKVQDDAQRVLAATDAGQALLGRLRSAEAEVQRLTSCDLTSIADLHRHPYADDTGRVWGWHSGFWAWKTATELREAQAARTEARDRATKAEARVAVLEGLISDVIDEWEHDGTISNVDDFRAALAGGES
jgi:hypothetical protein